LAKLLKPGTPAPEADQEFLELGVDLVAIYPGTGFAFELLHFDQEKNVCISGFRMQLMRSHEKTELQHMQDYVSAGLRTLEPTVPAAAIDKVLADLGLNPLKKGIAEAKTASVGTVGTHDLHRHEEIGCVILEVTRKE
jgi:hypothetical protein